MTSKPVFILIGSVLVCSFVASMAVLVRRRNVEAARVAPTAKESEQIQTALQDPNSSYRERQGWTPRDFFDTPDAIAACQAIMSRDHDSLQANVDAGLDVNQPGRGGRTLLHWALLDGDLDGFNLLLESGADPDRKLSGTILRHQAAAIRPGDSVLFTSVRLSEWEFLQAALPHTSDVNLRDGSGSTLLLACVGPDAIHRVKAEQLQQLLESGIELNARDKYGSTAALRALIWDRPLFSLQILKAGCDPTIPDRGGNTLTSVLRNKIKAAATRGDQYRAEESGQLAQWLAHQTAGTAPP